MSKSLPNAGTTMQQHAAFLRALASPDSLGVITSDIAMALLAIANSIERRVKTQTLIEMQADADEDKRLGAHGEVMRLAIPVRLRLLDGGLK